MGIKISDLSSYGRIWAQLLLVLLGVSSHARDSGFEFLKDFNLSSESDVYFKTLRAGRWMGMH